MSNYSRLRNSSIINPNSGTDLGTTTNTYGNIHMSGNLVIGNVTATASNIIAPRITSISYPGSATAANPAGGETITINGNGFVSGASVMVNGSVVGVSSVVSNTQMTFTSPALSAGGYVIYVINSDGSTAIYVPGIQYSGTPIWSTSAGSLGTIFETNSVSVTVAATGDAPITYSLVSGTLPTGSTFGTSSGVISGTAPVDSGSTLYSFRINAIDGQNQITYRDFTLTINTDTVTWSSPADNASYTLSKDQAMSTLSLSASSAAGKSIAYTANALPTGLTLSGSSITGTPTVIGNSSSSITATASGTNRTATRTLNWIIQISNDFYFNSTTLLLNTAASTTITDASSNNLSLTVVGDSRASNFGPYNTSWSNYFDGTGDYLLNTTNSLQIAANTNFTVEFWIYRTVSATVDQGLCVFAIGSEAADRIQFTLYGAAVRIEVYAGTLDFNGGSVPLNIWTHVAIVRSSSTISIYVNGSSVATATYTSQIGNSGGYIIGSNRSISNYITGYISNLRVVNGTALYTSTFTPSTTPLTAIANTSLLTCQSNRFIDNSNNNFSITKNGDTTVVGFSPFSETDTTTGSMYFDGTGDYLSIPSSASLTLGTSNFTIECWVYPKAWTSANNDGLFTGNANYSPGLAASQYYPGKLIFGFNGVFTIIEDAILPTVNVWSHVACTRSGNVFRIFINGVQSGSTITYSPDFSAPILVIGSNGGSSGYFNGYISNARVVKGTALYTSTFTPSTTPLTNITNTSLLTLQSRQSYNNSQFQDSSTNKHLIIRNGTPTQGTFTPFSQTGWSNWFDGATYSGFRTVANSNLNIASDGDVTVEFYMNTNVNSDNGIFGTTDEAAWGATSWSFIYSSSAISLYNGNGGGVLWSIATPTLHDNQWHHVAIVRSSGTWQVFTDGESRGTTTTQGTRTLGAASWRFAIGNIEPGLSDLRYTGYISNFRLTKSAVYTSNFTPSTTALTAIANTSLLTCQSNRILDNSSQGLTFTTVSSTSPSVQAFSPFAPTAEYSTSVVGGSGLFVRANSDILTLPNNSLLVGASDFSLETWVYQFDRSGSMNFFGNQTDRTTAGGSSWNIAFTNSTGFLESTTWVGGTPYNLSSSVAPNLNAWNYIVWCRTGSTQSLFLNGVRVATSSAIGGGTVNNGSTNNSPAIGANGGGAGDILNGYLSGFKIIIGSGGYNATQSTLTVPTAPPTNTTNTKVLVNFTNAGIYDSAAKNDLLTVGNARVSTTQAKWGTTSMYFDGTGDNLLIPNSPIYDFGTGNFTIEGWVYVTSLSGSAQETFVGRSVASGASFHIALTTGGTWVYYLSSNNSTWNIASAVSIGTYSLNNWQHIALVRNGTTFTPYLNGVAGTTTTSSSAIYWNSSSGIANCITVGGTENPAGTQNFFGYMDDIRITKGYARYTATFTPPSAAFIAR